MFLAIDVGNTNIVFGVFDGEDLIQKERVGTRENVSLDLILHDPKFVLVSSVVPDVEEGIRAACVERWGIAPVFVSAGNVGIAVTTSVPEKVGADRLVNAVGVAHLYQAPAIVIDFGTATTFDVIRADGAYTGGVIAPGVKLSLKALEEAAAQLPTIEIEKPPSVIGTNTVSSMQSGLYYGYIGLVEKIVAEITAEMGGEKPFVLATGGLASFFAEDCAVIDAVDGDLTLKGLQILCTTMSHE